MQIQFKQILDSLNQTNSQLVSPYTITLGDEFQAVLIDSTSILEDIMAIQAGMLPMRLRYSFAVGEIDTEINRENAIGMDGPGFHLARNGIESMRKAGDVLRVAGIAEDIETLVNCSLRIMALGMKTWKKTRFQVMRALEAGDNAQQIAEQLSISDKAVYKNIRDGGLEDIRCMFQQIAKHVNHSLSGR